MAFRLDGYIVDDKAMQEYYQMWGIKTVTPEDIETWLKADKDHTLYINSGGGSVFPAVQIYTALANAGDVEIIIDGMAASSAGFVAMAGSIVKISPPAQIMVHNVSSWQEGDYRDMENMADALRTANLSIINAFRIKTGLDTAALQQYMDAETWFDAVRAKELGFVDEILFDDEGVLEAYPGAMQAFQAQAKAMYNCMRIQGLRNMQKEKPKETKQDAMAMKNAQHNERFFMQIQINKNKCGGIT